jgi:pimeloyl-ACP methyl ester carboxylesterase
LILNYQEYGAGNSGLPLILIHGMGSAATAWQLVIPELAKSYRVIAVDLPGHGETQLSAGLDMSPKSLAEYVLETMDSLNISKAHLVGNSLGGWTALELAVIQPERVSSILGLAPAGLWLAPFNVRYPGTAIARNLASSLKVVSPFGLKYEWGRKLGFGDVSPQWQKYSYQLCLDATLALANSAGYFPAWDAMLKKRFDEQVSSTVPITIVFGDSDKTLPASSCQEKSLAPKHATWINWENCGHAPMWDYPERVVAEIAELAK